MFVNDIRYDSFINSIAGSVPDPSVDIKSSKYLSLCEDNIIEIDNIRNDGFHKL